MKNSEAGFSLIEIMLALAVIAVGLIAVVGLIPRGIQASRDAADSTIVATLMNDTFNNIRLQAQTTTFPPTLNDIYWDATGTTNQTSPWADSYYHIKFLTQSPSAALLTIAAQVTWPVKSASSVPPNTNIFFTSIANYQQ